MLLIAGAFIPVSLLKTWGLAILIVALLLITIGLIPYRRLTKLETSPDEIHCDDTFLFFIRKGKPIYQIPLSTIDRLEYVEKDALYGLCIWLKATEEKIKVFNPEIACHQHPICQGADLFFPYFSERSCKEIQEFKSPPE